MKAYDPKRRLPATQRNLINEEVVKQFDKIQAGIEKIVHDRVAFMFLIALGQVATDELGFGAKRRAKLIEGVVQTANNISNDLTANVCQDGDGNVGYDIVYNRVLLSRLATEYGIPYDEKMFDDDYLEDVKNAV